mgnify:CR=1 FL=1
MEQHSDIRWKQRFDNFEKAYRLLERTLDILCRRMGFGPSQQDVTHCLPSVL